ncbi:non-canonical purine NTP pyrophosphatase [Candidatus Azambacteria bacterium]|nr:non-canonical purine NTP pyrophosphatase [Candidatus Azambacteria bacterium]
MSLYFITGSANKFAEAKAILGDVEQLNEELPEIQEVDAKKIIEAKLQRARELREGGFIVEDTSLYFDCLCGLPGPLIKWFFRALGNEGIWHMVEKMGNTKAQACVLIGYAGNDGKTYFFEGMMRGNIVAPRGNGGFGWDAIFQPEGYTQTFGEIKQKGKNALTTRRIALEKLKEFLNK